MKHIVHNLKKLNTLLLLLALMGVSERGWGQIAQFNFPATNSLVVSIKDANVTVSNCNLSSGTIETNITTGSYFPNEPYVEETGGWTATSQSTSKNFNFTITANSGYTFTITNISFRAYATSAGPSAFGFGIGSSDIFEINAPDGSIVLINQAVSGQTNLTSATIKIQGWLNGSRTSAGSGVFRLDDIVITGTVTATASPEISISNNGTQVSSANVNSGTTAHILHKSALAVTTANASLTGMTCVTAGSYAAADITNLKVRYSTDENLDAGDATLSTLNNPGAAGSKTFPSFTSQSISSGSTGYIFITADIASIATHNNTININGLTTSNFTFSSGNKTGSTDAGGAQTIKDVNAPGVSTYNPSDNASSVVINSNLVLTFNENVQKGTGNITIHKISDNSIVQTIDVQDLAVSISNNVVTINPADFAYGTRYYVNIPSGAIQDMAGNNYAGISNNSTWNFTTIAPSVTNVTSTNADGSYKIGDLLTITVTFNDIVTITGTPYILLNMVGTDREASYSAGNGTATLSFTHTVEVSDDASDLDYVSTTSLALNGGTINSADGIAVTRTMAAPGAAGSLGYNKNIVVDGVNPNVNTYSPSDGNTTVTLNQNLILTFSENVKAGTSGNVVIYNTGGTPFETIPYNDSRITFSDNSVTINPDGTFAYSSEYYVQITNNAITDIVGNPYSGISNSTTWNFATVCEAITTFPYTQDFESGSLPLCWTQEFVVGNLGWQFLTGNGASSPANANSGSYNACLKNSSSTADVTMLVMPVFDLSSITAPVLSFWHTQAKWVNDQDELRVYYKTSSGDAWALLATYTSDVPTWTRRQINLPNPSSTYFVAFEGTADYGYGACIDDVAVGSVLGEPQSHITNLLSASGTPTYSNIELVWDDASGIPLPDGYLIKASTVDFSAISNPVDGIEEADGNLIKNVGYGEEYYSFSGLIPSTTYYFKVFPYTNAGSNINYKTDGEIPQTSCGTSDGPCLVENFDVNSQPTGWSQTDVTFISNYAEFGANNGSLATLQLGNANSLSFTLARTTNATAKSMIVEVSTTSQSSGYLTVATYTHSNTVSGGTTNCTVDLSAYSSSAAIYIRFRKASSTTSPWRLDNINVNCGELTIWKGTTNTVWETGTNWTNGTPTSVKSATIEDVINDPILTTSVECNKLSINAGSILTVASVGALKVNGTLTNNAGNSGLIIKSDATSTGSLIHNTAGVGATVERYISGGWSTTTSGWHQISSPVEAQALSAFETTGANNGYDLYGWDEPNNIWKNYKDASFATWNGSANFNVGQGYMISYEANQTKTFTGALNVSNFTKTNLSASSGNNGFWHLLGNPFASAIKWNDGNWALTNVAGTAKVWNELNKSYSDIVANGIIPSAQGFMIQVANGTNSLTIPTASRVHSAAAWNKSADLDHIILKVYETASNSAQESKIFINPMATANFDFDFDSRFLPGYAPQFYSEAGGEKLSTNSLPFISTETVIPLGFVKNDANSFSLEFIQAIPGYTTYLTDKKMNKVINLDMNPVYSFTAAPGDDASRFSLHFASVGLGETPATQSVLAYYHDGALYVNNTEAGAEIMLFGISGQLLKQQTATAGLNTLQAGKLSAGVYVVRVQSAAGTYSSKVIVTR